MIFIYFLRCAVFFRLQDAISPWRDAIYDRQDAIYGRQDAISPLQDAIGDPQDAIYDRQEWLFSVAMSVSEDGHAKNVANRSKSSPIRLHGLHGHLLWSILDGAI